MNLTFIFVGILFVFGTVNTQDVILINHSLDKYIINDNLIDDQRSIPQRGKRSSIPETSLPLDNFRNGIVKEMGKLKSHLEKYKSEVSQSITFLDADAPLQLQATSEIRADISEITDLMTKSNEAFTKLFNLTKYSMHNITKKLEDKIDGVNSSVALLSEEIEEKSTRKFEQERNKTNSDILNLKEDSTRQFQAERNKTNLDMSNMKEYFTRQFQAERTKTNLDMSNMKENSSRQFQPERTKANSDIFNLIEDSKRQFQEDILKLQEDSKTEIQKLQTELSKLKETLRTTVDVQQDLKSVVYKDNYCGEILESSAGAIVYKNSSQYSNNERCLWIVRIPKIWYQIQFTKLETKFQIGHDYIIIFTFGKSGHWETLILGKDSNGVQSGTVEGLVAVVMFTSDESGVGPGFTLKFKARGMSNEYNYEYYKDYIFSSGYNTWKYPPGSANYENKEMSLFVVSYGFLWRSSSPSNFTIQATKMDLEECCDKLILYNVERDNVVEQHRFSNMTNTVFRSNDLFILVFATDHSATKSGFELAWQGV